MRYLLAFLITAGLALPASAQNWQRLSDDRVSNSAAPGRISYYDFAGTSTTDSNALYVGSCGSFSLFFEPSIGDASTVATTFILECTSSDGDENGTADQTACVRMLVDTDGDGLPNNAAMTGAVSPNAERSMRFMSAAWIVVDPQVAPGGTDTARVTVLCHGG